MPIAIPNKCRLHHEQFAIYRQVTKSVSCNECMTDKEISEETGVTLSMVAYYLQQLRVKCPKMLQQFDELRRDYRIPNSQFRYHMPRRLDQVFSR